MFKTIDELYEIEKAINNQLQVRALCAERKLAAETERCARLAEGYGTIRGFKECMIRLAAQIRAGSTEK